MKVQRRLLSRPAEPARPGRYFEQALDCKPDSAITAWKLADTCGQSDQGSYANQVRLRFTLMQGSARDLARRTPRRVLAKATVS